jgi:outer membrane protein
MKTFITVLFLYSTITIHAQSSQKIGHADWEYIFAQMPEYKQVESALKSYESQLQNQLEVKGQELEIKSKSYQALPADTPEAIKKDKETELTYLRNNIQKFQQDASASLQKKQSELVNPVFEKVGKAIEEVALENGFAYIVNPQMLGGGDVLLFADEKYNVSNLVLKKLGVEVKQVGAK